MVPSYDMLETGYTTEGGVSARERILDASYELFSQRGIRGGRGRRGDRARRRRERDALPALPFEGRARARVPRAARAALDPRLGRGGGRSSAAPTPEERLLAIFDVFDEWFRRDDFEGCSFINVLLEIGDPITRSADASIDHLDEHPLVVRALADEAGPARPESFARSWHILMKGSIVSAAEGDVDAARRAKSMARLLIDQHR